jgi:F-type H+-transporting ATPase subunit delta
VRVAVELTADESRVLRAVLEGYFGRPVELEVQLDPGILGGVWVRVGDVVIDGSLQGRLETLRHYLHAQSRALVSSAAGQAGSDLAATRINLP